MKIERVSVYFSEFPIKAPYELSFGVVRSFRSIIVKISSGGKTGWGESTPLPGYTSDSAYSVYEYTKCLADKILGKNPEDAKKEIKDHGGFLTSALAVALEMLTEKVKWTGKTYHVPLVFLISSKTEAEIRNEIESALCKGYNVFKHKVGISVSEDLDRAKKILKILPLEAKVRFDANQGYTYLQALEFLNGISGDEKVELVEQMLKPEEWDGMEMLTSSTTVPMMLDESISTEGDISRASEILGLTCIKLKLFKCGSLERLQRMIFFAQKRGMRVVIGNGVSTGLGCLLEAKAWDLTSAIGLAGEMNGYLKMKHPFVLGIKEIMGGLEFQDVDVSQNIDESLVEKFVINKHDRCL